MHKLKAFFLHGIGRVIKWAFWVLVVAYIALVFFRAFQMIEADKTKAQVEKIHAIKLELADVMGKNLPPDPGERADDTIEGVDINLNGIRDDVELAIFEKYPNSPKTRAPLLQYAMALQMEVTQPFLNTDVASEVASKGDRAFFCMSEEFELNETGDEFEIIDKYGMFVYKLQLNNEMRKAAHKKLYSYLKGGVLDTTTPCDVKITNTN